MFDVTGYEEVVSQDRGAMRFLLEPYGSFCACPAHANEYGPSYRYFVNTYINIERAHGSCSMSLLANVLRRLYVINIFTFK